MADMNIDDLEALAQELVVRVRDDSPEDNGRWLTNVTSEEERWALLFVLAAAIPDDRPWRHLTMWTYGFGGPDTADACLERRRALLAEVDAKYGTNQHGRKKRAA